MCWFLVVLVVFVVVFCFFCMIWSYIIIFSPPEHRKHHLNLKWGDLIFLFRPTSCTHFATFQHMLFGDWSTARLLPRCKSYSVLASIIWSLEVATAATRESPKVAAVKVGALLGTGVEIGDRTIVETLDICCSFVADIFLYKVATYHILVRCHGGCRSDWETSTWPCLAHHLHTFALLQVLVGKLKTGKRNF